MAASSGAMDLNQIAHLLMTDNDDVNSPLQSDRNNMILVQELQELLAPSPPNWQLQTILDDAPMVSRQFNINNAVTTSNSFESSSFLDDLDDCTMQLEPNFEQMPAVETYMRELNALVHQGPGSLKSLSIDDGDVGSVDAMSVEDFAFDRNQVRASSYSSGDESAIVGSNGAADYDEKKVAPWQRTDTESCNYSGGKLPFPPKTASSGSSSYTQGIEVSSSCRLQGSPERGDPARGDNLLRLLQRCVASHVLPKEKSNDPEDGSKSKGEVLNPPLEIVHAPKEGSHSHGHGHEQVFRGYISRDLLTMLVDCAHAVMKNDFINANGMATLIRKDAFALGNGTQRVAHYFVEALTARLLGTGHALYITNNTPSSTEAKMIYEFRVSATPSPWIPHFFSNQTILHVCNGKQKVHIIDYGIISNRFQWPLLLNMLAKRPGGPPKLRVTGIDLPQPGFKPEEKLNEFGRSLGDLARQLGIWLEFHSVCSPKWESILPSSFNIKSSEALIVNFLFTIHHLEDESMRRDSPRKITLAHIRKMNPDIVILGVNNGQRVMPFNFMDRFSQALSRFGAKFDAAESGVREDKQAARMLYEQKFLGPEILNLVACEGSERVVRHGPYQDWESIMEKAGFRMLPMDRMIYSRAWRLMSKYHRNFSIEEDGGWLKLSWKNVTTQCVCAWKPIYIFQ